MHPIDESSAGQLNAQGNNHPVQESNSVCEALRAECARLQQRVKELEEERERDRHTLAAVQQECEVHRRWELARAKEYFLRIDPSPLTEDEILQMIKDGKAVPFEEVIAELEHLGEES